MMLSTIKNKILSLESNSPAEDLPQASVLLALTESKEPELIFTLRSKKVSSHGGEVSFPGGMKEDKDRSLEETALRESHEEIGLDPTKVTIYGKMNTLVSRFNVSVTPYVGSIPEGTILNEDSEEIDSIFKVPVSFFLEDKRLRNDPVKKDGEVFYVPAYKYDSYIIWGLTAMITVNFLNLTLDAGIDLSSPTDPKEEM
jgi:8-oxo-dGTP pyrophosphatase MutT (NUDIX family)